MLYQKITVKLFIFDLLIFRSRGLNNSFFMYFFKISIFWKVCWSVTPVILTAIFVIAMWDWTPPHYEGSQENIYYPDWAHHIGWFLTLVTALQIPLVAIFMVIYYGCKRKIREVIKH